MESIKGNVENLRFSTEASGENSSNQIAVFSINGQYIECKSSESIFIEEGDTFAAVGKIKNNVFKVITYKNLTKNIVMSDPSKNYMVWGVMLFVVGTIFLYMYIGAIFMFFGGLIIKGSRDLVAANKLLEEIE